jgi:hypothetical protein
LKNQFYSQSNSVIGHSSWVGKKSLSAVDSLFICCQETKGSLSQKFREKGGNITDSKSKIQNIQKGYGIEPGTPAANDSSFTDLVAQIKNAFAEARDCNNALAIGWASRSYAKTDENRVRTLLAELKVSPLALREATRRMTRLV